MDERIILNWKHWAIAIPLISAICKDQQLFFSALNAIINAMSGVRPRLTRLFGGFSLSGDRVICPVFSNSFLWRTFPTLYCRVWLITPLKIFSCGISLDLAFSAHASLTYPLNYILRRLGAFYHSFSSTFRLPFLSHVSCFRLHILLSLLNVCTCSYFFSFLLFIFRPPSLPLLPPRFPPP